MNLISVNNLTIKYLGRKQATLDGLNVTFEAGETVLLLGASGSGKSTLALALNGLIPNSLPVRMTGRVEVNGLDTQTTSPTLITQEVGIVFQDPEAQFVTLKVEDEIVFGLENLGQPPETMSSRVDSALAQVEMSDYRLRPVHRLSGGQKQRIALAALLAMEPRVLIFDEPTANLDPVGTEQVFELLSLLKERAQHTIILIEHKLDSLMHLIDRVIVLSAQGKMVADSPARDLFRDQIAFLDELGVWVPQVCRLAHRLGLSDPFPITLEEARGRVAQLSFPPSETVVPSVSQPIIEVKELSFSYGSVPILHDIFLSVPQGDFLAIVGGNGAGKTTLAHHLMTILPPEKGTIWLGGQDVTDIHSRDLSRIVGFVFQNPEHQFITPTVFDEVAYGLRVLGESEKAISERTTQLLERFHLARYAKANPFTLSHGEKRRLSVATMLAMGQDILILDEPTFGQDERNAVRIMTLLTILNREGRTVIIVTHDMQLVAEYTQHTAVLSEGRLLFHGATPQLFAQADLMAEANLNLPPLAQLGRHIGRPDLLTLADFTHEVVV